MSEDYFRFMFNAGVEPTNSHSEQQVRHVLIDRRITPGTRSESGQRYHEQMWTAIATCEKQEKNFLNICIHRSGYHAAINQYASSYGYVFNCRSPICST